MIERAVPPQVRDRFFCRSAILLPKGRPQCLNLLLDLQCNVLRMWEVHRFLGPDKVERMEEEANHYEKNAEHEL